MKKLLSTLGKGYLGSYKRRKQKSFNYSLAHCLNTSRAMLKKSKYCILITNNEGQGPSARMVQPIIDLDTFVFWIGTNPTLRKVKEIQRNPNVTLAFSNNRENANLIVYGKASIESGMSERRNHWIPSWLLFYPDGPSGDDFILIRVEPTEIELMNFKRNVVPPEPFGLKPVRLKKTDEDWQVQEDKNQTNNS